MHPGEESICFIPGEKKQKRKREEKRKEEKKKKKDEKKKKRKKKKKEMMRRGGKEQVLKTNFGIFFDFFFEICKKQILEIKWTNSRNLANFFFWENY